MKLKLPRPTQAEEMAVFRHGIVGDLVASELGHGELQEELKKRARKRYRPPGAVASRTYHWKTLQRWFHRCKGDGLLAPAQLLFYDHGGFVLAHKKLARGCYRLPGVTGNSVKMSAAELGALLEGIDLSGCKRLPRWTPVRAAQS